SRKPTRYIDGPYIASRPAYQIFADQARTGASIGDLIAADMRAQAKADGRQDPVKEMPENRHFWFHDGEMEPIPAWPNANSLPGAPAAPLTAPPLAPAAAPALPAAPAPTAPARSDPAPAATASVASAGSRRPAGSAESLPEPPPAPVRGHSPAAGRATGTARTSAIKQQLAAASYPRPSRQERIAQRAAARRGDPRAV
ncbi:MAG TPA: hypothetical protein VGL23_23510, partial [Chloroflexota bacterium]